jgi:ankyrin repeat protein
VADGFALAGLGDAAGVERLVEGAPEWVAARDGAGYTLLHWAALGGRREVMELLLARGADPGRVDGGGQTPLRTAASMGDQALVQRFAAAGAAVDARDKEGWTSLCDAAWRGDAGMVGVLLSLGAGVNELTGRGRTALDVAMREKHGEVVKLLKERGGKRGWVVRRKGEGDAGGRAREGFAGGGG